MFSANLGMAPPPTSATRLVLCSIAVCDTLPTTSRPEIEKGSGCKSRWGTGGSGRDYSAGSVVPAGGFVRKKYNMTKPGECPLSKPQQRMFCKTKETFWEFLIAL